MIDIERIRVASPCSVPWESMAGDERVRKCDDCGLNVHNLSAMNEEQIRRLVAGRDDRLCVRLYRRHDGTLLTQDCPTGLRAYRKRAARFVATAFASVLGLVSFSFGQRDSNGQADTSPIKIERRKSESTHGRIVGSVVDPMGAVVPGISVEIYRGGGQPILTETDAEGNFVTNDLLPGGNYQIDVKPSNTGFKRWIAKNLEISPNTQVTVRVTLEIADGIELVGVVGTVDDLPEITIEPTKIGTEITYRKPIRIPQR